MDAQSSTNSNVNDMITYVTTTIISVILLIIINVLIYTKFSSRPLSATESLVLKIIIPLISLVFIIAAFVIKNKFGDQISKYISSFENFKNTIFLILYIIFLVFLFTSLSTEYTNDYAYIILPIVISVGLGLLYISFSNVTKPNQQGQGQGQGQQDKNLFDINFARLNYPLIFLMFTIFIIILFVTNPGGYIGDFAWLGTLITTVLAIISLIYLSNVMRTKKPGEKVPENPSLVIFGYLNIFTLASFILFIIASSSIIPGIFTKDIMGEKNMKNSGIFILLILFFTFWIISFIKSLFIKVNTDQSLIKDIKDSLENYNSILKMVLVILIGLTALSTIMYWFVSFYQNIMSTSTIGNAILYFIIFVIVLYLVYKLVVQTAVYKESPLFQLIFNSIYYVPCLIVAFFDRIMKNVNQTKLGSSVASGIASGVASGISSIKKSAAEPTPFAYYIVLIISILLFVIYFTLPYLKKRFSQQGGVLLINRPIDTRYVTSIASYEQLNNSNNTFKYQYALSFWVYIDSASLSTNKSYETYATILDYGGKPNVSYNASLNTLRITMTINENDQSQGEGEREITNKFAKRDLDSDGNIIIYQQRDVLLQKWNNIIFNYSGGTLDIFFNGELVKSTIGIIPYMNYDNLVVGQDKGIFGQICNLNYFKDSLNVFQIYYLYNSVKDHSPPVLMSDDTVINLNANIGLGNILGDSAIMTDLPPGASDTSEEKTENDLGGLLHTDNRETDYLSLKWYFNASKDIYN